MIYPFLNASSRNISYNCHRLHPLNRINMNSLESCFGSITVMSHEHHDVSNHRPLYCWFNILFMPTTTNKLKLCITSPLWRGSSGDQWFPSQMASNAESVSMSWRHRAIPPNLEVIYVYLPSLECEVPWIKIIRPGGVCVIIYNPYISGHGSACLIYG